MEKFEEKYKKEVINTLKRAIKFFEDNELSYFMACGSALGAARHNGMIPWDDDTDIYMLRDDYNKLFDMGDKLKNAGLNIAYLEKGKNYYAPFLKIYNNEMTLWETPLFPFTIGPFIDVFPLDKASFGMQRIGRRWSEFHLMFNHYRNAIENHSLSDYLSSLLKGQLVDVFKWLVKRVVYRRKRDSLVDKLISFEQKLDEGQGDLYVSYTETQQYIFPREWFSGYIEVPFEDFKVRLPKGYKEYLTYFYGDYMKLPPEGKRISTHTQYYINFKEHLDIVEAKKRIKKGKLIEL